MKISKFKKMANNKYRIYIDDDTLDTYDEVIIANNLLYKKEIDNELYNKILEENKYYDVYNKCIKMLSTKLRSKNEIEKYLEGKVTLDDKNKIIDKLIDMHLIDDTVYAKAYIKDKINFTNQGPNKIYNDLISCDIDSSIILNELNNIDRDILLDRIIKHISKKIKSNKNSGYIFKKKIIAELINNGYEYEMIREALDNFEIKDNVDSEFNKIYSKLSRKYQGDELVRNIKNKLYQKGYNKDTIEDIIKRVDI